MWTLLSSYTNFSLNSFIFYPDKMILFFVENSKGEESMNTGTQKSLLNLNINFHLI